MGVPFTDISKLYINGAWEQADGGYEDVLNPATEQVIGRAPIGDTSAAHAAIAAARHAFDHGPWPLLKMAERADALRRMHAALLARRAQIVALIVAEVGCAQGITNAMQVDAPLTHLLAALDHATRDPTLRLPLENHAQSHGA